MKPLPVAPITKEDYECWRRHGWFGSDSWYLLCGMSRDADRRDAELMLLITRTGRMSVPHPNGRAVAHSLMSFGIGMEV